MKSPIRHVFGLYRRIQMRDRILEARTLLEFALEQKLRLIPIGAFNKKQDLLYKAVAADTSSIPLASVRVVDHTQPRVPDEPDLPRVLPEHRDRLARETMAYRQLGSIGLSPVWLAGGENFLANSWLDWPRLSDLLRTSEDSIWILLPKCLLALNQMHQQGVAHLDLNCGNILVSPIDQSIVFVDFEYQPTVNQSLQEQQAFDYVRFTHSLLKRRRALRAAIENTDRFCQLFHQATEGLNFSEVHLPTACFSRIQRHPYIYEMFRHLFRASPPNEKQAVVNRSLKLALQ